MISVIITTYNRSGLLKRAIKSVLAQSEQDFELLVIDDCSTDNTKRLTESFKNKRIKYYSTLVNSGYDSLPKNIGIEKAQGEYITFLDDDDIYRVDTLKILLKYIKQSKADIVYGDYLNNIKHKIHPGWSINFNLGILQKMNYISMSVTMVKRETLLKVGGFDEDIKIFKDWNLWLRLAKQGYRFLHIPIIITEVYPQKEAISEKYKDLIEYNPDGSYRSKQFNPADCKIYPDNTSLGSRQNLKVAIFTLTKDRYEYTRKMAKAMYQTAGYPFDWFVIDQGSKDETLEFIKTNKLKIKASIFNKENTGIAKGWNDAIKLIKETGAYDVIIKLDNDAEMMTRDWLKIMIEIFERNKKVILSPYVEGLEDSPGGVLRQRLKGDPYVMINDRVLGVVPYLGGICWAAPAEVYNDFKFEENSFYTGGKDYIISKYAQSQEYGLFYMEELRLRHIDGTKGQKLKYPKYFEKRQEELTTKYEK